MLAEVDRYAPPEPAAAEIDRRVADIRARAGTEFERVLLLGGIGLEQLRREVRDDLRIDAYLQQRFGAPSRAAMQLLASVPAPSTNGSPAFAAAPTSACCRDRFRARP